MDADRTNLLEQYSLAIQEERQAWIALQAVLPEHPAYQAVYDYWRITAGRVTALGNELWADSQRELNARFDGYDGSHGHHQ